MPQVTGATHEVGVDQLFFSTTDARGVIRHSNNVFSLQGHVGHP